MSGIVWWSESPSWLTRAMTRERTKEQALWGVSAHQANTR